MGTPSAPRRLSDEVLELLSSGVDAIIATRDAALVPECTVGMGLRVHRDRWNITVFLAKTLAETTLRNLADNGQIAVTFCRPIDHNSVQLKGRCTGVRDSGPADREVQEVYRGAFAEQLAAFGLPRAVTRRFAWWPSVAIDIEVDEVFGQTPGPGAGERIGG
jgi:hypothetical protein